MIDTNRQTVSAVCHAAPVLTDASNVDASASQQTLAQHLEYLPCLDQLRGGLLHELHIEPRFVALILHLLHLRQRGFAQLRLEFPRLVVIGEALVVMRIPLQRRSAAQLTTHSTISLTACESATAFSPWILEQGQDLKYSSCKSSKDMNRGMGMGMAWAGA